MPDFEREESLFRKRIDEGFYTIESAGNSGDDYVDSGRIDRDTEAVAAFVNSDDFNVIRELR